MPSAYIADTPPSFIDSADVLLLLQDNLGEGKETLPFQIRFPDFSGKRFQFCGLALLKILYAKQTELPSTDSAYTAARFGHKYDAPLLLKRADAYLSGHVFTADQPQVHAAGRPVPAS